MMLYLVIGSLVLLNLLIAMMAKTFDTIEERTTGAIIFARYTLALDRDATPSYCPPPLNVPAMCLLLFFYIIEKFLNLMQCCTECCTKSEEAADFDFAVLLMPQFMKERKLELDDQILYKNCHRMWTINTNKGATKCKIVRYKSEIGQHYVRFYNDKGKGVKVSVGNSVEKKHQWQLDLFDLHRDGNIDFSQFNEVIVDRQWTDLAHKSMEDAEDKDHQSPYWICGYCRAYVKASKISLKRLGYMLNVGDLEMKIVTKLSPELCPNCYRVRLERSRIDLVWEIISYWLYKIIVSPVLIVLFFTLTMLSLLGDADEFGRAIDIIKSKIISTKDDAADTIVSIGEAFDENSNDKNTNAFDEHKADQKYVSFHYSDTQLISNMNEMDDDETLFDVAVRDDVWDLLANAKNDIDVYILSEKINSYILTLSTEDELTTFEFFDNFINMDGLRKNGGDTLWNNYFKPLSLTMFERVQKLRKDVIPLHLFKRYPFDLPLVLDDFAGFFDSKDDDIHLKDVQMHHIVEALQFLQPLNCINEEQREKLMNSVRDANDPVWELTPKDSDFDKFVRYMSEVQTLFQDTRIIKNMLRDVSTAIVERGAASSVFRDQIHFLFQDIRNVTLATPYFNSMRTEIKKGDRKVELWTIRNTLYALYFLSHTVRAYILRQNARLYVTKQELLNMVYQVFQDDIIDPEGITDIISDSESDSDEEDVVDMIQQEEDVVDHVPTGSFIFAQKSTIPLGEMLATHEEDEAVEEEKQKIVVERMELFHKGEITASAVRDEVSAIFNKTNHHRQEKITETTIDYYRRKGLGVKLLQDDETLRYMFEQLSRYATFHPNDMKKECNIPLLKRILCDTLEFGDHHHIDRETLPKLLRNDICVQKLYDHLHDLYMDTKNNKFNSIILDKTLPYMTMEDVSSMIMLYERTYGTLMIKKIEDADVFVASHDVFCKFVDPKGFDPDKEKHEWTNKTVAASDLFQAVLDEQQSFVTLGQIRQTINKLMKDIEATKCGELTRIMNHLHQQFKNDEVRCKNDRVKYVEFTQRIGGDELNNQLALDDEEPNADRQKSLARKKKMKNPGLAFKHISKSKWTTFMDGIALGFSSDVSSKDIAAQLDDEEHRELLEKQYDESSTKSKEIIEAILDNTAFDIIDTRVHGADKVALDEMEEEKYQTKKKRKSASTKKRDEVFDTVLSFCAGRITLQQLFQFSKHFRKFLRRNDLINKLLKKYHDTEEKETAQTIEDEQKMKQHRIAFSIEKFKEEYFSNQDTEAWEAEINYLFLGCENRYDLCHKIYPFWHGTILKDIYSFMESTEQIQGNYELKAAEFGQLKHSLNVNDELAMRLFHIIRFKIRTLSWKQIYNYFKFLLKMKYNAQRAILQSKQAEDTTISLDGIKMTLKIQLNDESVWLFDKVDSLHGAKVTWKQIRKYLKKMIAVRDEMRDFFHDNARDREYEEKQAEIVNAIHDNVETNTETAHENHEDVMKGISQIVNQLNALKKEIKMLKQNQRGMQRNASHHSDLDTNKVAILLSAERKEDIEEKTNAEMEYIMDTLTPDVAPITDIVFRSDPSTQL